MMQLDEAILSELTVDVTNKSFCVNGLPHLIHCWLRFHSTFGMT